MTYPEILARVEAVTGYAPRPSSDGHTARCPAHGDTTPSLSLSEGDDGRTLWNCHKPGCEAEDGVRGLGLTLADLFVRDDDGVKPKWDPKADGYVQTARSVYLTADGTPVFEKLRREPKPGHPARGLAKSFTQRRPDPDRPGRWLYNLRGIERPLYRLPEVLAAVAAGRVVLVVEGEKDADALAAVGFVATCNDGGAGKWGPQHTAALAGAHVVVVPDNDRAGRSHTRDVSSALGGVAASVRVLTLGALPDGSSMPAKGDVSDWLSAGGTADALKALARAAPPAGGAESEPEPEPVVGPDAARAGRAGRPTIPDRVYALLPPALADASGRFEKWTERGAFLTALLVCLSGALPHVRFRYGRHYLSPHLFGFLYGPAASGKGVVTLARAWLHGIDDALTAASTEAREAWQRKKDERDRLRRSRKKADQRS